VAHNINIIEKLNNCSKFNCIQTSPMLPTPPQCSQKEQIGTNHSISSKQPIESNILNRLNELNRIDPNQLNRRPDARRPQCQSNGINRSSLFETLAMAVLFLCSSRWGVYAACVCEGSLTSLSVHSRRGSASAPEDQKHWFLQTLSSAGLG
jgi:hypothetical protein